MSFKKIVPFLFVCLVAVLIGCFSEGDIKPVVETDQMELKADYDGPITQEECQATIEAYCNCTITVVGIADNLAEWSLNAYNVGGNNHRCCVNNSWQTNFSLSSGCNQGSPIEIPQNLACGLNTGSFGLEFNSISCTSECPFELNHITLLMECGSNTRQIHLTANETGCIEKSGKSKVEMAADCRLE